MPNKILADLQAQVEASTKVEASATLLINGFASRMQAAVDKAIANGATAEELAPVTAEINALKSGSDELAAAVKANTEGDTGGGEDEPQSLRGGSKGKR